MVPQAFMKAWKLLKPFEAPQRRMKIKFKIILLLQLSEMLEAESNMRPKALGYNELRELKDRLQISLLILREFKGINELLLLKGVLLNRTEDECTCCDTDLASLLMVISIF